MPWLHRLACFRDDVVFCILIYQVRTLLIHRTRTRTQHTDHQRWIYRVDYSRVNEYGQVNEGMVEPVGEGAVEGEKVKEIESKKTK
jgi:hypothetical protein